MGEIGKNITVIEQKNDIILVDCGMTFPEDEMLGIDIVIPDITYLFKNRNKIKGMVLTHGHEDHIGAIPYILPKLNIPIYGTKLTLGLLETKFKEHKLENVNLNVVKNGDTIKLGSMEVEFIKTSHSIPDSSALAITTSAGVIIHTGDFKIDYTPIDGDTTDLSRFGELGRKGVLALMADSTNAERPGYTMSERTVGNTFKEIFSSHKHRIIVATFASNVHRIQQIINASEDNNRKVVLSGRSMVNTTTVALELGYLKIKDDKPTVVVQGSGINQTIIKTAIDQTLEMNNAVTSAIMHNPNLLHNKILDKISNSGDYMNDITNKSSDRTVLYFYTLIGMACLYSGFFGIVAVNQNEANLSKLGSRLCVSPTKRSTTLMASLMAGLAVSYIGQLLLYVFLAYILKINFGQNGWAILLIMLFGCLAGVMLGMLVSACNKKGENFKTGLLLGVTMFFSFLAGMMGTRSIKYLIDVNMPVLAYINPVNLISDALFSTYYFGLSGRYWTDLIALIGFIVVSVLLSWIFLRKRKYASL